MKDKIKSLVKENLAMSQLLEKDEYLPSIESAAKKILGSLKNGGKVLIFGNGGSAAQSQHMAAELVGRFKKERKAISAIALTTDTSILTALANDYGYKTVFKRQVEALGRKGDVALGISTSGTAENVTEALKLAKDMGLETILLTGKDGGDARKVAGLSLVVPSNDTARIQEAHILIIHILCNLVEDGVS